MITTVTLNTSVDKLYLVEKLEDYTVMRVKKVSNTAGGKGLNVSKVAYPVSYTHLDVYKRQNKRTARRRGSSVFLLSSVGRACGC